MSDEPTALFWSIAEAFLAEEGVTRGTMMGFPCLRWHGDFFASCEHRTGALIVKLDATRVNALIARGEGVPFAPAGRRFREWVMVEDRDARRWTVHIRAALRRAEERAS